MARPLRIEFDGAFYHVTSRGNTRNNIFFENNDYLLFIDVLAQTCQRHNWRIHSYCLLTNHYHILVETPEGNLCAGMQQLNGVYTQRINRKHGRVGHLFQGRFKGILVDTESYYKTLVRYVLQNPVRANMVNSVEDYPWSSYCYIVGKSAAPKWFVLDDLLAHFNSACNAKALAQFIVFVNEIESLEIWECLRHQTILGDEVFAQQYLPSDAEQQKLTEVPKEQKRPTPMPLIFYQQTGVNRNDAILSAHQSGGYTMIQIANHFGLHYSTVSRIIARFKT